MRLQPRSFFSATMRAIGERATKAIAIQSLSAGILSSHTFMNDVHIGQIAWRCGPNMKL